MMLNKRFTGLMMVVALLFTLALPALAAPPASAGKNTQGPPSFVQEKMMLKGFTFMNGNLIKVKKRNIKFDVPPVIKGGRTLIPVRAITEALGAQVDWDPDNSIVTITKDGKVIKFYLTTGEVFVDGVHSVIDVPPGLINNRTFVPLRFIAETFGLRVGYNDRTGEIDIDEIPAITPTEVEFDKNEPADLVFVVTWNGFSLTAILNEDVTLTEDVDYTVDGDEITLKSEYLDSINGDEIELKFLFTSSEGATEDIEVTIEITPLTATDA